MVKKTEPEFDLTASLKAVQVENQDLQEQFFEKPKMLFGFDEDESPEHHQRLLDKLQLKLL